MIIDRFFFLSEFCSRTVQRGKKICRRTSRSAGISIRNLKRRYFSVISTKKTCRSSGKFSEKNDRNRDEFRCFKDRSFALIEDVRSFQRQWIPAAIVNHDRSNGKTNVNFYNCVIESLSNNNMIIPINTEQFERYSTNRIKIEKKIVGKAIVGFNRKEKMFMLGTVDERIGNGHEYQIKWCNGEIGQEDDEHLFAPPTANVQFDVNQYVLTIDVEEKIYRLGQIISISNDRTTLTVRLCRPDRSQRSFSLLQTFKNFHFRSHF